MAVFVFNYAGLMKFSDISHARLKNQGISDRRFKTVKEAVAWMGAVQAQDYNAALWAIGLRVKNATQKTVEDAIAKGDIIRVWPMRRTIHFVAREDARWMLDLTLPIALKPMGPRGEQAYGLTEEVVKKARAIITKALKGGKSLTRPKLYEILDKGGVATRGERKPTDKFFSPTGRGLHLLVRLAHDQVICFGPREGKQPTFVLLDEWVPRGKTLSRDEALAELALRYFSSHGPAQIKDLGWWSGLSMKDIKRGIELNGKKLTSEEVEGNVYWHASNQAKVTSDHAAHLLPAFDEYLVAYRDRDAALAKLHAHHLNPGANGMFANVVVISGQVVGNWKRTITKSGISVTTTPFEKFSKEDEKLIEKTSERYKKFIR